MLVTLALVFQTQTLQILGVQKGLKVLKYQENIFNILLRKHHIQIYTFVYIECVWLHSNRSVCVCGCSDEIMSILRRLQCSPGVSPV